MSNSYRLLRGGKAINIQKEARFLTAILPNARAVQQINQLEPVEDLKQVFNQVYKIQTKPDDLEDVMRLIRESDLMEGVSHHAYNPIGDDLTRYYLTDMLVVSFQSRTNEFRIERIMEKHGLSYLKSYEGLTNTHLFRVTKSAGKNPLKLANDLIELSDVENAEPNLINRFKNCYEPKDGYFKRQWHLKSKKGIELVENADVRATEAWEITKGSRDIVIAILDDGFDLTHPDLRGEHKIVFPKDFKDGDLAPFPEGSNFHGTPVAGVAIGEENGSGIIGIAPGCSFMPIRLDFKADDNLLWEIFDFVGKRADVISNSWGPLPVYAPLSDLLYKQFSELSKTGGPRGKGCLIIFAAGNFNAPVFAGGNANFKWKHPKRGLVTTKGSVLNGNAAHPDVFTVSASTSQNRKALYSNWGKEINICAPSSNWNPMDTQDWVPGRGIWTADNESIGLGYNRSSRYTAEFGGTSSSAPLVAGIAGLVLSVNSDLTANEVKNILQDTADKIEDKKKDKILKQKKGTYDDKGHSEWFGYGKVNAEKAVRKAVEMKKAAERSKEEKTVSTTAPIKDGIQIVAAIVNPKGVDAHRESVSLLNVRDHEVHLSGWSIIDSFGRSQILTNEIIKAGAFLTLPVKAIRLSNRGGTISLLNAEGQEVDKVAYSLKDGQKEGWTVKF